MRDHREDIPDPRGETHQSTWVGPNIECNCGAVYGPVLGKSARQRHSDHITFRMHLAPDTDQSDPDAPAYYWLDDADEYTEPRLGRGCTALLLCAVLCSVPAVMVATNRIAQALAG